MGFVQSHCELTSGTEYPDSYTPGGYHRVKPGDRLNAGRYKAVLKLGHGAYSTVWLAHEASKQRFVAIKIAVARSIQDTHERDVRELLSQVATPHPGRKYVQPLLDVFVESGPNGIHQCFASTPGAASIATCMSSPASSYFFSVQVSRAIAAQMILATEFLHSQEIAHGDLHLGNFLVLFPAVRTATAGHLSTVSSSPFVLTRREDGTVPAPRITPSAFAWDAFYKPCHEMTLVDARIMLTDFGGSWSPATEDKYAQHTPFNCRPPEGLFAKREGRPLGMGADIWMLACAVFAVHTDHALFELSSSGTADKAFAENVSALGRPPSSWWDMWDARDDCVTNGNYFEYISLRDRVLDINAERAEFVHLFNEGESAFGDDEMTDLGDMLAAMLKWNPDERIAVSELVDGAWMRKWGHPMLNRMETEISGSMNWPLGSC